MGFIGKYRQKLVQFSKSLIYSRHPFILFPQSPEILFTSGLSMSDASPTHQQITSMLRARGAGDSSVSEELIRAAYKELRWRARHQLQCERANHTLQTTALINEAYLKLVEQRSITWQNRSQFFGLAAELMRRILVVIQPDGKIVVAGLGNSANSIMLTRYLP
jgi:hypothetical protein